MAEAGRIDETKRKYLQTNSNSLVFVDGKDKVDSYRCCKCQTLAIRHNTTNCGHLFCSNCIMELFENPCPICSVEIIEVMKVAMVEKGILELNVECQYKIRGCQEIIPLHKYQEHDTNCRFSTNDDHVNHEKLKKFEHELQLFEVAIKEIREDIDKVELSRNNVTNALRNIGDKVYAIDQYIQQMKISSRNAEELKTVKEDHENLNIIGQEDDKLKTKSQEDEKLKTLSQEDEKLKTLSQEHEKLKIISQEHQQLIHQLQYEIENRKEFTSEPLKQNKWHDDEQALARQGSSNLDPDELRCRGTAFFWKITGFQQKWLNLINPPHIQDSQSRKIGNFENSSQPSIQSDLFHNVNFDYKFSVNLKFNEPYVCIDLARSSGFIFLHSRKFTLIDQSDRADKRNVSFINSPLFSSTPNDQAMKSYFCSCNLFPANLLKQHFDAYVKDDTLLIKICFLPLALMYKSVASSNGILLWGINDYARKKQEEINGMRQCLISDSFYTSEDGYLVQARLFLNGDGDSKGKHLSISVDFITGEFDKGLPVYFNAIARFFLRDLSESCKKQHVYHEIAFPYREGRRYFGKSNFVLQSKAEEATYLKADFLLFKILVAII